MTTDELRKKYLDFFVSKQHRLVVSDSLIPRNDPTLLFTGAGMNQFKEEFLGRVKDYCRATTCQKCLRTPDLENVGKTAGHHTFFEMLGNFSFGDYFKKEAITWAWEFLTKELGLSVDKLVVSVYEEDDEAFQVWHKEAGLPLEKIYRFNAKENYWPANAPQDGPNGPCGPCSEIFYDQGAELSCGQPKCDPSCGCDRYVEIWNLVFTQFDRQSDGTLIPLPNKNIDTGMGLERMARILQSKISNYDTDVFIPIINAISDITGMKYTAKQNCRTDIAFRVVADHLRALTFAITDGGVPSNEGRGYVLRRILRRASRFGRVLGMHEPFIYKLVDTVVDLMGDAFGELGRRADFVKTVIESEEAGFGRTLDRGLEIFKTAAAKAKKNKIISAEDAFQLYDTFGFPLDLTQLMAREQNLTVDTAGFDNLMEQQKQRARAAQKTSTLASFITDTALPVTDDSAKYQTDTCTTRVLGWIDSKGFETANQLTEQSDDVALVLEKTCF